jgi:hypothetical protein
MQSLLKYYENIFKKQNFLSVKTKFFLMTILISGGYAFAQTTSIEEADTGPFSYNPPEGVLKWQNDGILGNDGIITLDNLSPLGSGENGLMVAFDFKSNLINTGINIPIASFYYTIPSRTYNVMKFSYSHISHTIIVTRYFKINSHSATKEYDYPLFDPILDNYTGSAESQLWRVKIYFTAHFMFIVGTQAGTNRNFMSPLFFGFDEANLFISMRHFLRRTNKAKIQLGGNSTTTISNVEIRSFIYNDWWQEVQQYFSSPNPPGPIDN